MEDDEEDEDNDSEKDGAVGQENALKLGESILQALQKWASKLDMQLLGIALVYLKRSGRM
jgi:hypothetical protein